MAGSDYLARQAATLLRLAKITKDAKLSAKFAAKTADLNARADDALRGASPEPSADRR